MVNRLPYGEDTGNGFGASIPVLAYPALVADGSRLDHTVTLGYDLTLNFGAEVRAAALSGAVFEISLSNERLVSVNFAVDGNAPKRGENALSANPASSGFFTVPFDSTTYTDITSIKNLVSSIVSLSASGAGDTLTFANFGTTGLRISLSGGVTSYAGGVSSSVVGGLEDANDIFTLANVTAVIPGDNAVSHDFNILSGTYLVGAPTQFLLSQTEYNELVNGTLFTWDTQANTSFNSLADLAGAAIIVANKGQTTIDGTFQGYYLGLADNTNINPATDYNAILNINTVTTQSNNLTGLNTYTSVPKSRFDFALSATNASGSNPALNSISQIMEEKITGHDISTREYDDTLNIGVFKMRQSVFSNEATTLTTVLEEGYNGSIGHSRVINSASGGAPVNFFLENIEEGSRNIQLLVNPYIADTHNGVQLNIDGTPKKKIRMVSKQLVDLTNTSRTGWTPTDSTIAGCTNAEVLGVASIIGYADALFPLGAYGETTADTKKIGDIPGKLDRALARIKNDDVYNIDLIPEAGLGTIWTTVNNPAAPSSTFDDTKAVAGIEALRTSSDIVDVSAKINYTTIFDRFATFCGPLKDGGRGDIMFIADPLRQILVTGKDTKVADQPNKTFSVDIYWALRHQFEDTNTSYAAVYANYVKVWDSTSGIYIWAPSSGFAAAKLAAADAEVGPWQAAAGFNRGILGNASDIAIAPNQRQRDELYKVNLNPISRFPDQGMVVFGQKTLLKKPSAFDRINVRRTFLYLEKAVKKTMNFFLFENNTTFTRTRVINTLSPFFGRTKTAGGLYDFLLVCDERNNSTEVIDNNELIVDIYIKPVRSAEFILVNFYATRTDTNFSELIGG
jgi:hypothetical protein